MKSKQPKTEILRTRVSPEEREQIETTPADTEPTKSGCGGFAHSSIAIAAMGAAAVVLKKKKKK